MRKTKSSFTDHQMSHQDNTKQPTFEPSDEVYVIGDRIIMHPMHLIAMREQMHIAEIGYS